MISDAGQQSLSLCRPAFFVSGQEIVIVIGVEIVLSPAAASQRFTVADLLQVIQPAGNAAIAVAVECIQGNAGPAIDAGVHLGAFQNGLAVGIHDARRGAGIGVNEHAARVGGIALALLVAVAEGQLQVVQVGHVLAGALQLALALFIRGADGLVDLLDGKYDTVTTEITQRGIRRREFGRFIQSLEKLPDMVTEFSEELWGSLVDHVTVHSKENIIFTLTSGMEIKA